MPYANSCRRRHRPRGAPAQLHRLRLRRAADAESDLVSTGRNAHRSQLAIERTVDANGRGAATIVPVEAVESGVHRWLRAGRSRQEVRDKATIVIDDLQRDLLPGVRFSQEHIDRCARLFGSRASALDVLTRY